MENETYECDLPRVLLASSTIETAQEIIDGIGQKSSLCKRDSENSYVLSINNKYYTAQVLLCPTDKLSIDVSDYEALIFYYDLNAENLTDHLEQQILPVINQADFEILLFVSCPIINSTTRDKAIHWCVSKKIELIELFQKNSQEIVDLETDQSKYGIERIIEALEAHAWPNICIKANQSNKQPTQSDIGQVENKMENIILANSEDVSERLQMESVFDEIMNNEDKDFGELFTNLRAMKEHAATLPSNQRRVAAEQLVIEFWNAIGGDPSEVQDLT